MAAPPDLQPRASGPAGWSRADLNRRHTDFQSVALPTELLDRVRVRRETPARATNIRGGAGRGPMGGAPRLGEEGRDGGGCPPRPHKASGRSGVACNAGAGRGGGPPRSRPCRLDRPPRPIHHPQPLPAERDLRPVQAHSPACGEGSCSRPAPPRGLVGLGRGGRGTIPAYTGHPAPPSTAPLPPFKKPPAWGSARRTGRPTRGCPPSGRRSRRGGSTGGSGGSPAGSRRRGRGRGPGPGRPA